MYHITIIIWYIHAQITGNHVSQSALQAVLNCLLSLIRRCQLSTKMLVIWYVVSFRQLSRLVVVFSLAIVVAIAMTYLKRTSFTRKGGASRYRHAEKTQVVCWQYLSR